MFSSDSFFHSLFPNFRKSKMKRMRFAIDIKSYDKAFEQKEFLRNNFRNQHNIALQDIAISVVGKLVDWKSQDHLIKLLQQLEQSYPTKKVHLLIAGSGLMEDEWKMLANKLTKNKVHFLEIGRAHV